MSIISRNQEELKEHIVEQKGLLENAVSRFYAGDMVESLNIATRIRIFVHESHSSVPLLKQIDRDYLKLQILDKESGAAERAAAKARVLGKQTFCSVGFRIGSRGTLSPVSDLSGHELTTLESWWLRPSLIFPHEDGTNQIFTRRGIVLTLAEKDGGVHVDPSLPEYYNDLIKKSPIRVHFAGQEMEPINLGRYLVGQSGNELLDCLRRNF